MYVVLRDADNQTPHSCCSKDVLVILYSCYVGHYLQKPLWQQKQLFLKSCWDSMQRFLWGQTKVMQNHFFPTLSN